MEVRKQIAQETAEVRDLIRSKVGGRFFTAEFTKKNGEKRRMLARLGVSKFVTRDGKSGGVTGEGMAYNPDERGLLVVWDAQAREYRMINLLTLEYIASGDFVWRK